MGKIVEAGFEATKQIVADAVGAGAPVLMIGDPGVGKTALASEVGRDVGLPVESLIGSTLDPTDVGGLPAVIKNEVRRFPLPAIRRACKEPVLLFLDEVSTAPPAVQAAFLRLVFERVAGDDRLHEGTRVVLATNPEEQSPGGVQLSAPLVGRVVAVRLRPRDAEVRAYLANLGDPDGSAFDKALRREAADAAATMCVAPDILQVDCPPSAAAGGEPWASPRAWERAVRCLASAEARGSTSSTKDLLAGSLGIEAAAAYVAIRDLRASLPSIDDVVADPDGAVVPDGAKAHAVVGAGALAIRVADRDLTAAWIYADRLPLEVRAACGHALASRGQWPAGHPAGARATEIRKRVLKGGNREARR